MILIVLLLHIFLSNKNASGALNDSLNMYFQRFSRFGEIGLVRVGDVYGVNPKRLPIIRQPQHVKRITHQNSAS